MSEGQISPKGVPNPPQGDTSTFLQKVAMRLYSIPSVTKAADSVINAGESVARVRDNTVKAATTGLKVGLYGGPLLLIVIIGLYAFVMLGGPIILARSKK